MAVIFDMLYTNSVFLMDTIRVGEVVFAVL